MRSARGIGGFAALTMLLTGVVMPAHAISNEEAIGTEDAAVLVATHENSIADEAASMDRDPENEAFESSANDVEIALPLEPSEGISIEAPGISLDLSLPSGDVAAPLEETGSGLLAYDNQDGSFTVPIAGEAGDLQLNTVIASEAAPKTYEYEFELPAGATAHFVGGGLVFLDPDGSLLLMMAEPWATDSMGNSVPTHYEVDGHTVAQIVEHGPGSDYPIVADPWLGVKLFFNFEYGTYRGEAMYSGLVTPQAAAVLGAPVILSPLGSYALWLAVMGGSGWDEWKAKWSKIANKPSLRQQYDCHVAAGIVGLPFTRDYNLERFRPNRKNGDWIGGVAIHHCNWAKSTGNARN